MHRTMMVTVAAASLLGIAGCKDHAPGGSNAVTANNASMRPAAAGAEAINGSWKLDVNSVQFDGRPDEYILQNGIYTCKSCTPAYSVAADGAYHPVTMPYFDSDSVRIADARTVIESSKKGNKPVRVTTTTVSADGSTSNMQFKDTSRPGSRVEGVVVKTRVGRAPAGAHAISGQWKPSRLKSFNDGTFTSKVSGDMFQWSSPDGTSYEAKIGDGDTPLKGDIADTWVSVAKVADNSYQVTFRRGGRVVGINTMTVGADGKLNGVNENKENRTFTRWAAYRFIMP